MKTVTPLILGAALLLQGCVTTPKVPVEMVGEDGYRYRKTDRLDRVWLAEGFAFQGLDGIWVKPVDVAESVAPKDEKETQRLFLAQRALANDLALAMDFRDIAPTVSVSQADMPAEGTIAHLETTIIDFSRGSSSLRFGVGFGTGMPFIRVQGRLFNPADDKELFRFQIDESGDWFGAGYTSTKTIQNAAAMELAEDLADFMAMVARGEEVDYEMGRAPSP